MRMKINEAIEVVRGIARQKRAYVETIKAHPLMSGGHMQHITGQTEREAEALEAVCGKLTEFLAGHEEDNSYHSK